MQKLRSTITSPTLKKKSPKNGKGRIEKRNSAAIDFIQDLTQSPAFRRNVKHLPLVFLAGSCIATVATGGLFEVVILAAGIAVDLYVKSVVDKTSKRGARVLVSS